MTTRNATAERRVHPQTHLLHAQHSAHISAHTFQLARATNRNLTGLLK